MVKTDKKNAALLLAQLAHELRQPLTGISTSAQLLLESHADDPAVCARAATIFRQAQRIQLMVERARRQGPPPSGARGDLNQAVEAAWSLLEAEAAKRGAALVRNLSAEVPPVSADQIALEQIFGNLLRNALEAVAGRNGRIRVSTAQFEGGVEAIVEDDGPGVPPDLRARLFSPFSTQPESRTAPALYITPSLPQASPRAPHLLAQDPH